MYHQCLSIYLATTKTLPRARYQSGISYRGIQSLRRGQFRTEGNDLENVFSPGVRISYHIGLQPFFSLGNPGAIADSQETRQSRRSPGKESPITKDSEQNVAILFQFLQSVGDVLKAASLLEDLMPDICFP